MKKPTLSLLTKKFGQLFTAIVLICSCTYKTDEVYLRDANPNIIPPEIQTINLNLQTDTIFLHDNLNVNFEFKSLGQSIFKTVISIDGQDNTVLHISHAGPMPAGTLKRHFQTIGTEHRTY